MDRKFERVFQRVKRRQLSIKVSSSCIETPRLSIISNRSSRPFWFFGKRSGGQNIFQSPLFQRFINLPIERGVRSNTPYAIPRIFRAEVMINRIIILACAQFSTSFTIKAKSLINCGKLVPPMPINWDHRTKTHRLLVIT